MLTSPRSVPLAEKETFFHPVNFNFTCGLELSIDRVKLNQHAKYLGQRDRLVQKLLSGQTGTQTHNVLIALPGPLKWSITTEA